MRTYGIYARVVDVSEIERVRFVRLNSICSEIKLTESVVFDFVRLPNSIELNPRIEFDLLCRACGGGKGGVPYPSDANLSAIFP